MRAIFSPSWLAITLGLFAGCVGWAGGPDSGCGAAFAQIIPDGTLPTTVTSPNNLDFAIAGGSRSGNNLFHSFSQFSVPTGGAAVFNNATNIQNIFSRVTGGSISNIDGAIRANGSANLFLLNPSGILFGPNASLNLGGSFIGTTAHSIKFADGTEFNATQTTGIPLLTMSVPMGLQMGQNPGAITVQGPGHRLIGELFIPLDRSQDPIGLQVGAGNTLAFIGGAVNFSGGVATVAGGGHVEVGSVGAGQVRLNPTAQGWVGDYSAVGQFNDIHLAQQSLLDASGSGGSIQIRGRNINFTEGSAALIQNFGAQPFEGITIKATEALNLTGNTRDGRLGNLIRIENLGIGQTGDITIAAAQLSLQNGGDIRATTYTSGFGGNVVVNVAGLIEANGFAPLNPGFTSAIAAGTYGAGNASNLTIATGNLRLLNGGNILAFSVGQGQAGIIRLNTTDLIEIVGINPITFGGSAINSTDTRSWQCE